MKYITIIILAVLITGCYKISDASKEENRKADSTALACGCGCATENKGWWQYIGGSNPSDENNPRNYYPIGCTDMSTCPPGRDILCIVRAPADVYGVIDMQKIGERRYTKF
jgi:hypothetical protein